MTTYRTLVNTALAALAAALLSLVPASGAWAMLPHDPESTGSGTAGPTTVVRTAAVTGFGDWQVITIGALCALVAVVATLLATRIIQARERHPRLAHV
jgi:hypothetical protein